MLPMTTGAAGPDDERAHFLASVADVRPDLLRYCARMVGSTVDGEDIVQDTFERAFDARRAMEGMPSPRPWLFRVAHHRAIDFMRRYERRMGQSLEDSDEDGPAGEILDPEEAFARAEATRLAVSRFVELAPLQRSCVVLKDVLSHSVDEIVELLDSTEPAVKAAIHRGREKLKKLADTPPEESPRATSEDLARYVALFNAGDWDALRNMLANDVRLHLPTKPKRHGRQDVGRYFSNYERTGDVVLAAAWLDGREVIAAFRKGAARPAYVIALEFAEGKLEWIRDYRYAGHMAAEAEIVWEAPATRGP